MPSVADKAKFLQIIGVTKEFDGYKAVDDVTLDVGKGEIFALLGPSGCGKSTLLRMLAGFETPTAGRIVLDGRDLAGLPPYERPINMMFQSYALFPHLSVADNIVEFGLVRAGDGLRIYGAGILSSPSEVSYALSSPLPRRIGFNLKRVMGTRYKIDSFQQTYFVIDDFGQLFRETAPDFTPLYAGIAGQEPYPADAVLPQDRLFEPAEN